MASYGDSGEIKDNLLKENINKIDGLEEKIENIIYDLIVKVDGYEFRITQLGEVIPKDNIEDSFDNGRYYLYNNGNEYIQNGGEWINNDKVSEYEKATLTKENNDMIFEAGFITAFNPTCTKSETMDISEYDYINLEIEILKEDTDCINRNIAIQILSANGALKNRCENIYPQMGLNSPNIGEKTKITMDISKLNELNDIYFGVSIHGYKIKIYSIYLQKHKKEIKNLYNAGNEYTEIGGEWVNSTLSAESNKATLTKNEDHMLYEINQITTDNPMCSKQNIVDVTGYNVLKMYIERTSIVESATYRNICLFAKDRSNNYLNKRESIGPYWGWEDNLNKKVTLAIDLSNITNPETYIGLDGNGYTIKIYKVWLEKYLD